MRLAFPNGEHDPVTIGKGSVSIGSSDDDDIVLQSDGLKPGHAVIIIDKRGITLNIEGDGEGFSVNGRPVREKAILRMGDLVNLNGVEMLLRSRDERLLEPPAEAPDEAAATEEDQADSIQPARFHLRGIAGKHLGQIMPVRGRFVIGSDPDCDLVIDNAEVQPQHVAVIDTGTEIYLRNLAAPEGIIVNGNPVKDAVLNPGDQLVFDSERLAIEAPGYVPGRLFAEEEQSGGSNTQVFSAFSVDKKKDGDAGEAKPAAEPREDEDAEARSGGRGRDLLIIGICLALSAGALLWIYFNI